MLKTKVFNPAVLSGLQWWTSAAHIADITTHLQPADGVEQRVLPDLSGANVVATAAAGLGPKFAAAATPSGLPALKFVGTERLLIPSLLPTINGVEQPFTLTFVYKALNPQAQNEEEEAVNAVFLANAGGNPENNYSAVEFGPSTSGCFATLEDCGVRNPSTPFHATWTTGSKTITVVGAWPTRKVKGSLVKGGNLMTGVTKEECEEVLQAAPITGPGIPANTTVAHVHPFSGEVVLSNVATETVTNGEWTYSTLFSKMAVEPTANLFPNEAPAVSFANEAAKTFNVGSNPVGNSTGGSGGQLLQGIPKANNHERCRAGGGGEQFGDTNWHIISFVYSGPEHGVSIYIDGQAVRVEKVAETASRTEEKQREELIEALEAEQRKLEEEGEFEENGSLTEAGAKVVEELEEVEEGKQFIKTLKCTQIQIGKQFEGYMAEGMAWNRKLEPIEMQKVMQYLGSRYRIATIPSPPSHPAVPAPVDYMPMKKAQTVLNAIGINLGGESKEQWAVERAAALGVTKIRGSYCGWKSVEQFPVGWVPGEGWKTRSEPTYKPNFTLPPEVKERLELFGTLGLKVRCTASFSPPFEPIISVKVATGKFKGTPEVGQRIIKKVNTFEKLVPGAVFEGSGFTGKVTIERLLTVGAEKQIELSAPATSSPGEIEYTIKELAKNYYEIPLEDTNKSLTNLAALKPGVVAEGGIHINTSKFKIGKEVSAGTLCEFWNPATKVMMIASKTKQNIKVGEEFNIVELLYPTVNENSPNNLSVRAFCRYCQFVAETIQHYVGGPSFVETSNEPVVTTDPWTARPRIVDEGHGEKPEGAKVFEQKDNETDQKNERAAFEKSEDWKPLWSEAGQPLVKGTWNPATDPARQTAELKTLREKDEAVLGVLFPMVRAMLRMDLTTVAPNVRFCSAGTEKTGVPAVGSRFNYRQIGSWNEFDDLQASIQSKMEKALSAECTHPYSAAPEGSAPSVPGYGLVPGGLNGGLLNSQQTIYRQLPNHGYKLDGEGNPDPENPYFNTHGSECGGNIQQQISRMAALATFRGTVTDLDAAGGNKELAKLVTNVHDVGSPEGRTCFSALLVGLNVSGGGVRTGKIQRINATGSEIAGKPPLPPWSFELPHVAHKETGSKEGTLQAGYTVLEPDIEREDIASRYTLRLLLYFIATGMMHIEPFSLVGRGSLSWTYAAGPKVEALITAGSKIVKLKPLAEGTNSLVQIALSTPTDPQYFTEKPKGVNFPEETEILRKNESTTETLKEAGKPDLPPQCIEVSNPAFAGAKNSGKYKPYEVEPRHSRKEYKRVKELIEELKAASTEPSEVTSADAPKLVGYNGSKWPLVVFPVRCSKKKLKIFMYVRTFAEDTWGIHGQVAQIAPRTIYLAQKEGLIIEKCEDLVLRTPVAVDTSQQGIMGIPITDNVTCLTVRVP